MIFRKELVLGLLCASLSWTCTRGSTDKKLDEIIARLASIEAKCSGGGQPPGPPMPKPGVAYQIPVHPEDAHRGGAHAKVTIVEAFEFACPYCAMIAPTLTALSEQYKPEDLKIVSKHLLIHPDVATTPALASCAAHRQGKFGDFEKTLWNRTWGDNLNQPDFKQGALAPEALSALAKELGLDVARFEEDMKSACIEVVKRNLAELGGVGVIATPSIFINGIAYGGDRSVDGFKAVIDEEIKKADEALKNGAKLEEYYATIQKDAKAKIE